MLELHRSDIGFGTVTLDDRGVTHAGPLHRTTLAWDEVADYRLTIEFESLNNLITNQVELLGEVLMVADLVRGYQGTSNLRLGIDLHGGGQHVGFNWRFKEVEQGIAFALKHVATRLLDHARRQLAASGTAQFGPIQLSRTELRWGDKVIERDAVESVELFDSSPVELRVMARGKALPYAHAPTAEVPDLCGLLRLARELEYPVTGRGLLRALKF